MNFNPPLQHPHCHGTHETTQKGTVYQKSGLGHRASSPSIAPSLDLQPLPKGER